MKRIFSSGLFLSLIFFFGVNISMAQVDDPATVLKDYVNDMVQKVEKAETAEMKRTVLNNSFDELLVTFNKVEEMKALSEADQKAINNLKSTITERQNELNGLAGYKQVPNNQLNNFAHFVQQNMEMADTVTISIAVLVLLALVLLLI